MNIVTSEWVSLGHPDKTADYISEYILDEIRKIDKNVRYALEVQIKDNIVNLAGEITTRANIKIEDYEQWVKQALRDIGYTSDYAEKWGKENAVNAENMIVNVFVSAQSSDIAIGVDNNGWGDQGIFFGFATNMKKTHYMPLDAYLAREFGTRLFNCDDCGLDIKTQVTISDNKLEQLIVAAPVLNVDVIEKIIENIKSVCEIEGINYPRELIINGTGIYKKHSSMGDCGITGRKLAVDFYGGNCEIGGGSPWTKDASKADLTLNAYARKLALDFIRQNKEYKCAKAKLSCCIGRNDVYVTLFDLQGNVISSEKKILSPKDAISELKFDSISFANVCRIGLPYYVEQYCGE